MAAAPLTGDGPWVSTRGGNKRRIHPDPECPLIDRENVSVRSAAAVEIETLGKCKHCLGTIDRTGDQGPRSEKTLRDMDPEEFDAYLKEEGLA